MHNDMSKPDLASIFNLKFYRKQKKWRFVRDVLSEDSPTPECSHSARALLNQTYHVEAPAELPIPAALDEAFIESGNGADLSPGGDGDLLTEDSSHPKPDLNRSRPLGPPIGPLGPPIGPLGPPIGPLGSPLGPPDLPTYRTYCADTTFADLDFGKSCPDTLHKYPDEVTDYPHCDMGCLREEILQDHGQSGANGAELCDLGQYLPSTGLRRALLGHYLPSIGPRRTLQEWDEDLWRDQRELLRPSAEELANGWPAQAAVWNNTGQNPDQWMLIYYEAARALPELVDFQEEEQLLMEAQLWLEKRQLQEKRELQEQRQRQEKQQEQWRRERCGSPPLHCDVDCFDGNGCPDENLLMDKLNVVPRDRMLARSPASPGPSPVGNSPSPPGDSPRADQSFDSERFMLGAHTAPHSSEIELISGDSLEHSSTPLDALVWRHARALRDLLQLARTESDRPSATHSGHNVTSFEEFPTRDVGPSVPQPPQTVPQSPQAKPQDSQTVPQSPKGPLIHPQRPLAVPQLSLDVPRVSLTVHPPCRGRGRARDAPVVGLSAGRPYRL